MYVVSDEYDLIEKRSWCPLHKRVDCSQEV